MVLNIHLHHSWLVVEGDQASKFLEIAVIPSTKLFPILHYQNDCGKLKSNKHGDIKWDRRSKKTEVSVCVLNLVQ